MSDVAALRIALIGCGEVGGIFGAALVKRGLAGNVRPRHQFGAASAIKMCRRVIVNGEQQ